MKKLLAIIITSSIISACANKDNPKFVNPIFYNTLEPYSTTSWQTQLTPTKRIVNIAEKTYSTQCSLIENSDNAITYKCPSTNDEKELATYRYSVEPDVELLTGKLIKLEIDFEQTQYLIIPNK